VYNGPGYPKAATGGLNRQAPFCGAKAGSRFQPACDSASFGGAKGIFVGLLICLKVGKQIQLTITRCFGIAIVVRSFF